MSDSTEAAIAYRYNSRNQCVRECRRINHGLFLIHSYGYDKAGNRTRRVLSPSKDSNRSPVEELYRYDAGNRLIELVKQGSVTALRMMLPEISYRTIERRILTTTSTTRSKQRHLMEISRSTTMMRRDCVMRWRKTGGWCSSFSIRRRSLLQRQREMSQTA